MAVTVEIWRSALAGWSRKASLKKQLWSLIPKGRRCGIGWWPSRLREWWARGLELGQEGDRVAGSAWGLGEWWWGLDRGQGRGCWGEVRYRTQSLEGRVKRVMWFNSFILEAMWAMESWAKKMVARRWGSQRDDRDPAKSRASPRKWREMLPMRK